MRKGTAILIGFNCRFWAMQNSNENVYMCAMSGKTEIDRERERERERENEAQKCGMQFACKPVKATAKIKPNGKPKIETFLRLEMRVEMHVKS